MSLFVDKHNRRKSPFALAVFGMALLEFCLFGVLYALLAEPLYHAVAFASPLATAAAHSLIIAAVGTAASCLGFLLPDKRLVPWGFAGLGVILCMFCASALLLEPWARGGMLGLILAYGLLPVLVGSAVSWPVYMRLKRSAPPEKRRKTIRQELLEAAAKEAEKQERKQARQVKKGQVPAPPEAAEPEPPPKPPESPSPEEALFGPESGGGPSAFRSEEEEAMLLYMDDDDDEAGDD